MIGWMELDEVDAGALAVHDLELGGFSFAHRPRSGSPPTVILPQFESLR